MTIGLADGAARRMKNARSGSRFFFALLLFALQAPIEMLHAETEFGAGFGPFLPFRISGVREVLNGWSARVGTRTSKGVFEIDYFNGHGDGNDYHTIDFDFRLDLVSRDIMPEMPVFLLLGLNADMWRSEAIGPDYRQSGGWHYGGGVRIPIGGTDSPLTMRADFKHRFGPGNSLILLVGFAYSAGATTAGAGTGKP